MKSKSIFSDISSLQSISVRDSKIEHFLGTTSASVYCKDRDGAYLDVNDEFLRVSDRCYSEVIKNKDRDLIWHEQASTMRQHDQEVIDTGRTKTYIESAKSPNNIIVHYLSHKAPLLNHKGKTIGIFGLSFQIRDLDSITVAIEEMNSEKYPISVNEFKGSKSLNPTPSVTKLSNRQLDCLYYLVKGQTIKQIAVTLNLSSKTVEHYLEAIKNKLNCHTRAELIEKALKISIIKDRIFNHT